MFKRTGSFLLAFVLAFSAFSSAFAKDREPITAGKAFVQPDGLHEENLPSVPEGTVEGGETEYILRCGNEFVTLEQTGDRYVLSVSGCVIPGPVVLNVFGGSTEKVSAGYDSVEATAYGLKATAEITASSGSSFLVTDCYWFPEESDGRSFCIRRSMETKQSAEGLLGFSAEFTVIPDNADSVFVPHKVYGNLSGTKTFRETELGLPFVSVRRENGKTVSLARYQPVIDRNHTASFTVSDSGSMTLDYPSKLSDTKYFVPDDTIVFDISITLSESSDFNEMMVDMFSTHFELQDQRITDTDIEEVLVNSCEDYKKFMQKTVTGSGIALKIYSMREKNTPAAELLYRLCSFLYRVFRSEKLNPEPEVSYGLPWTVTIETGHMGPKSYQSGFVGQQIYAAYEMLFYGFEYEDAESLENGLNILNFWIDSGMMNESGVPKIWYDGTYNNYNRYPVFLRMAVDAMEGYLDAYRLASEKNVKCDSWYNAICSFADFLVKSQNEDGSFFRCYAWSGKVFEDGDDGITEPGGNICSSYSKENTSMPVRFLYEMYRLTEKEEYLTSAVKAGNYVYDNQYARGYYIGGTCDNPNVIDKEAGTFAMYCYNTMYEITGEAKWLNASEQAAAFVMSMVQCFSFPAGENSTLLAAAPFRNGYNDGMSFIISDHDGLDSFAGVIYYDLFRIYEATGEKIWLDEAEFIQQNSRNTADNGGVFGFPYRSIQAEATSVSGFSFFSAQGPDDGVQGVWLPWQSAVNLQPMCRMINDYGCADVVKAAEALTDEK